VLLASETRPGDWADWLERAGLPHRADQRRRVFDHFFVTLQAVVEGLGIGIGALPVLQTDVVAERLLTPFPAIQVLRTGYVALVLYDVSKTSVLTSFIDGWSRKVRRERFHSLRKLRRSRARASQLRTPAGRPRHASPECPKCL